MSTLTPLPVVFVLFREKAEFPPPVLALIVVLALCSTVNNGVPEFPAAEILPSAFSSMLPLPNSALPSEFSEMFGADGSVPPIVSMPVEPTSKVTSPAWLVIRYGAKLSLVDSTLKNLLDETPSAKLALPSLFS